MSGRTPMNGPVQPGDRLDHYRIESLVAQGGMASVFRGTDTRTGSAVAIKIPKPEMECDVLVFDRFQREAGIGRRLAHPGVVKVNASDDPSRVYMVLEWVEGRPLREILDEGHKLPHERVMCITLGICEALAYIHGQGVIHRDLKPENIMVDSADRIKLIDFGIAGEGGARRLTFGRFTRTMGTPDYVSPEQVKGKRGDARSDIYALGVILYEMLTGVVPFGAENPFVAMNRRLLADPAPVREFDCAISPQMQEIIFRALERDPDHRYPTAHDFGRDLAHPDQVGLTDRTERHKAEQVRGPEERSLWRYLALALIPIVVFALLVLVAHLQ
jgi:serine/threonine protein kinase